MDLRATSSRRDLTFAVGGDRCAAWHYSPAAGRASACIVMAHGFGLTRDAGLEAYAERFVDAGYHALVFDYRHFGASAGEPRQLLSPSKQVADWNAAATFARTLPGVTKVALWGTSFSGGHVVSAAARDPEIAAVSAQCPMMDGRASVAMIARYAGVGQVVGLAAHGLLDVARAALRLSPHMLPVFSAPGTFAALATEDSAPGYGAMVPAGWRNEVAARLALTIAFYRPVEVAHRVRCPLLVLVCDDDAVASPAAAAEVVRRAGPRARLVRYAIGHYDIYAGVHRERAIAEQLAFFGAALRGAS